MKSFASLRDRIRWFQEPAALRTPLVSIIDAVQDLPAHFQVLSVALTFNVMCDGIGMTPMEVMERIERMKGEIDSPFANQIKAMTAYVQGELNE